MNSLELKSELHGLIEKINDTQLLNAVRVLLTRNIEQDWWEEISSDEKEAILQGLKEADAENLIPHNVVMEEIKEKYSNK